MHEVSPLAILNNDRSVSLIPIMGFDDHGITNVLFPYCARALNSYRIFAPNVLMAYYVDEDKLLFWRKDVYK